MTQQLSRRRFLRNTTGTLGAATLGSSLPGLTTAQDDTSLNRVDLGHAWVIQGAGGNIYTLPGLTEDGALMIDGGREQHADVVLDAVFDITGQERVHTLINTHFHPEQTGCNERVGAEGGIIMAHEKTKWCLQSAVMSTLYDGRYGPLADAGIPNRVLGSRGTMKFAGQEIIYGYLPAAHTNGDMFFYFPMLDTLVAGGPVTAGQWPLLDIRQGAWMGALLTAYETLSDVVSADTIVVPAHGPIISGTDILRMRAMYTLIHLKLSEELNKGMGPDDIVAMDLFNEYESDMGDNSLFLNLAHRSIQQAYVPD